MTGAFVAVVGPSGSGKDTLIAYASERLSGDAQVAFVRRVITRPCDGATEQHDSLSELEFETALEAGAFAVAWRAHGLHYGIPRIADDWIEAGKVVVANVSRGAVGKLRDRYVRVIVAEIGASAETLARRLAARGRESHAEVLARLGRQVPRSGDKNVVAIDNSGTVEAAGERLVALIRAAMGGATRAG